MSDRNSPYYYANNKKVGLEESNQFVAVDLRRLPKDKDLIEEVRKHGRQLRREVFLVQRNAISNHTYARIQEASAEDPVYLHGDALLVVLPEIRVEDSNAKKRLQVEAWAKENHVKVEIDRRGRMTIEPSTGIEALAIANQLQEDLGVEMAQARMLRMVAEPGS